MALSKLQTNMIFDCKPDEVGAALIVSGAEFNDSVNHRADFSFKMQIYVL